MRKPWPMVELKEIVTPEERPAVPEPGILYRQIGVKLWGQGAYERESIDGADTKYKTLSRVESDDIIVNKIWARNGSVAVVPKSLSGCYASGEFPLFSPNKEKLSPRWFHWITKTRFFWDQCDEKSRGTSGKNRIRPERFLEVKVPLPPLPEQQRIVARIEELAGKIDEAQVCRLGASSETKMLWPNLLRKFLVGKGHSQSQGKFGTAKELLAASATRNSGFVFPNYNNAYPHKPKCFESGPAKIPPYWVWTTVGSVVTHIIDCVNDTPNFTEEDTGLIGLKSTNVRPYQLDLTRRWFMTPEDFASWNRRERPLAGDILLTREAPVGYACLLPDNYQVCLTQRLMLLRPDHETILPKLLLHYLNSPHFHDQVEEHSRGLTTPHIRVQDAPNFLVPLPPMEEQQLIVDQLNTLHVEVDTLWRAQAEITAELEALLPVILDRAFKAELMKTRNQDM